MRISKQERIAIFSSLRSRVARNAEQRPCPKQDRCHLAALFSAGSACPPGAGGFALVAPPRMPVCLSRRTGSWASIRPRSSVRLLDCRCVGRFRGSRMSPQISLCWAGGIQMRLPGGANTDGAGASRSRCEGRRRSAWLRRLAGNWSRCEGRWCAVLIPGLLQRRRNARRVSAPRTKTCPWGPRICCWAVRRLRGACRCWC
jgi:hypothetical protein